MKKIDEIIYSRLYINYMSIDPDRRLQKIHFFEKKRETILNLPVQERYDIIKDFLQALYGEKDFQKYILYCEWILPSCLDLEMEPDNNTFKTLLYQKGKALSYCGEFDKATHVAKELLKMDPYDQQSLELYLRSQKKQNRDENKYRKAWLIAATLTALALYFVYTIFIKSFYPELSQTIYNILLFNLGIIAGLILFGEISGIVKSRRALNKFMTMLHIEQEEYKKKQRMIDF